MKDILLRNTWEIFNVAKENKVDVGVGRDMFISNLRNYKDNMLPQYLGASVNYKGLSEEWNGMELQEQLDAIELYEELTGKLYKDLAVCRNNNDKKAFNKLIKIHMKEEK